MHGIEKKKILQKQSIFKGIDIGIDIGGIKTETGGKLSACAHMRARARADAPPGVRAAGGTARAKANAFACCEPSFFFSSFPTFLFLLPSFMHSYVLVLIDCLGEGKAAGGRRRGKGRKEGKRGTPTDFFPTFLSSYPTFQLVLQS
jgi:hypothetical protein